MKEEKKQRGIIGIAIILIVAVIILIRSFYGFCWSDESFYISTVHRLWQGDKIFVEEWNLSQAYAVILLPFYSMFMWIRQGNTEGIYLAARIFYLLVSMCVSLICFRILCKKHSVFISTACALIYFIYSRANIYGVSYYNFMITFSILSLVLIYDVILGNVTRIKVFFAGIFLALAVVCNAYLLFAYIGTFCICLFIPQIRRASKYIVVFVGGSIVTGIIYLTYVFSNISIDSLKISIPFLLSDSEHEYVGFIRTAQNIFWSVANCYRYISRILFVLILFCFFTRFVTDSFRQKYSGGGILRFSHFIYNEYVTLD